MKLLILLLISFGTISLQAQKTKVKITSKQKDVSTKSKPVAKSVPQPYKATSTDSLNLKAFANEICTCISQLTDSLHPILKDYFNDYVDFGEKEATRKTNLAVAKLTEDEKNKFNQQSKDVQLFSETMFIFNKRITTIETSYQGKINAPENSHKESVFEKILLHYSKAIVGCKTISLFYHKSEILD